VVFKDPALEQHPRDARPCAVTARPHERDFVLCQSFPGKNPSCASVVRDQHGNVPSWRHPDSYRLAIAVLINHREIMTQAQIEPGVECPLASLMVLHFPTYLSRPDVQLLTLSGLEMRLVVGSWGFRQSKKMLILPKLDSTGIHLMPQLANIDCNSGPFASRRRLPHGRLAEI
jgi:hypothetical protein